MENIETLRSKLVERIFSTKNVNFLQAIENLFLSVQPEGESDKYILSETQKEMILIAEDDIKYGRTISDEELRKLDEEWMK
ncbi:hypothetical protein J2X97_000412 [Epilithonimonas hungarica]|uniref:hypothetical protein n=1 Tax=Epilithonimonas hungarica TaxID=454006 RepID=UPI002784FCD1|nr:hypothetical protein [Epilithonimonas hungarica]MDP9954775.1 hypothetical protein [Epilithonimonas hungarica]